MKTIYESDELKITKQDDDVKVIDKISDHWFRLDFFDCFYNDRRKEINQWDFCKQYPTVVPILVDLGELKKWKNGFKIGAVDRVCYYDMQMIHKIVEYRSDSTYYSRYGKLHRIDGPAAEYAYGGKQWWINDKLHRMDGPAIEYANGDKKWYIDDNDITKDVEQWLAENNYTIPFDKSVQAKFILTFAG